MSEPRFLLFLSYGVIYGIRIAVDGYADCALHKGSWLPTNEVTLNRPEFFGIYWSYLYTYFIYKIGVYRTGSRYKEVGISRHLLSGLAASSLASSNP